jgi:hypothetical protein
LAPSIALTAGRTGTWEEDEDSKLKEAVQTHGDKDWVTISLLVPGRTKNSVAIDGRNSWTLIVEHSGEKNTALSRRRLLWGRILAPNLWPEIPLSGTLPSIALAALKRWL